MDLHELCERRSLAYHSVIAQRLIEDSSIVESAQRRVAGWLDQAPDAHYALRWNEILAGTRTAIAAFLVEQSERATELRQSSPFAGVLSPVERWKIWRAVGDTTTS
jgi:hypothetical protein